MDNWRAFKFKPGEVYALSDVPVFYVFIYSELVMESFVRYHFKYFDGLEGGVVHFHEERDASMLRNLKQADPAAQVLYGKEHP